jgi:hypothetical protein
MCHKNINFYWMVFGRSLFKKLSRSTQGVALMNDVFNPGDRVSLLKNNLKGVVVSEYTENNYKVQFDGVPQPVLVKAKGLVFLDNKESE